MTIEQDEKITLSYLKLLPGEELLRAYTPDRRYFDTPPSSLNQILRLTRANHDSEIGKYGPSIAALALETVTLEKDPDAPDHLRLYEVVFGRDSLRVAIDLITSYPELARTTVLELAKLQGTEYNTRREEEPGRIVHEVRDENSPIALQLSLERGWGWPYYGTVDATPEFIRTLTAYCRRSEENTGFLAEEYVDKTGQTRTIAYALESAIMWIEQRLKSNPEGLIEFKSVLPMGIENQVWKDSWDSYHHQDGTIANHNQGIASIEVQVTTYDALIDAAELLENVLDNRPRAAELRATAKQLKQTIMDLFWVEDDQKGGYFALGTDRDDHGNLRQLRIRTSNMGHTLNSRLLEGADPEIVRRRELVLDHMLSPEMLNVSGIRTLASDELRFRPGAYHNGSVWLWDTHHIAKGMRRLGYTEAANDLDQRLLKVVAATNLLPEYVRGDDSDYPSTNHNIIDVYDRNYERENRIEQPPQEVQAWTAAAILATKKRLIRSGAILNLPL
ncbi:hypothetical protein B7Y94_00830 [Candidatus Saccharibacteria bacterium 32-49-12]|nr:MAG: hypothetical protein B7Y94_00830 [Candidatus Saccharibacteria bacterium 32-49-12]